MGEHDVIRRIESEVALSGQAPQAVSYFGLVAVQQRRQASRIRASTRARKRAVNRQSYILVVNGSTLA
jgi:hypothetical protein